MDADDGAVGKKLREDAEGDAVGGVVEGRHSPTMLGEMRPAE